MIVLGGTPIRKPWPTCAWCASGVSAHRLNQYYICCACYVAAGWPPCTAHEGCKAAAMERAGL